MNKSLAKLVKQLDGLSSVDLRPAGRKGISLVQETAKALCPVNEGELRESIYTHEENKQNKSTWECYTNKKHGTYVEFGTGPVGQVNHDGVSPDVSVAYSQKGWMIPGDAMERRRAESYGLGVAEDKDGKVIGYYTNGQPARPFMYPALKNNEENITNIFANHIKNQIGESIK